MIKKLPLMAILLFSLLSFPAKAGFEIKDAIYFMKDDNIFSPEEMDEEAEYVYNECQKKLFQRRYYDCRCVAGAFRQKRDRVQHSMPQSLILEEIFSGGNQDCTNKEVIAGETYANCQSYAKTFRTFKTEEENESYCKCVANKMALSFAEKPNLKLNYIENLRLRSMSHCK